MIESKERPLNILVIGMDAFNRRQFERIKHAERFAFHELLPIDTLKDYAHRTFDEIYKEARERLDAFEGPVDAIITHWDFPATLLQAVLTSEYGKPGPSLEACLKCEHKFWMRREQDRLGHADVRYEPIDPFGPDPVGSHELDYPFWLKPIKSTNSMLGFPVDSPEAFERDLDKIRRAIEPIARSFNQILRRAELPEEIAAVEGHHCIGESLLSGTQHTVCGYITGGRARVYGVIDSLNYPGTSSFLCYEYPSRLDAAVQERMAEKARRTIERIGLDQCAFNIEFFHDPDRDRVDILEINPRISQSHGDIFRRVDGQSDELLIIELGLGEKPEFPYREGRYNHAAKFYVRSFEDGRVKRVPSEDEVAELEEEFHALIHIGPERGRRLSDMIEQDSASFVLAECFLGAGTSEELHEKFEALRKSLPFVIE